MEKKLYLATAIAVIAAIGLILSCGLSYFSDTEEVTYNTFTAGVSDSCVWITWWGYHWWNPQCTDNICDCEIENHIDQQDQKQCRIDCYNGCNGFCNVNCYKDCLATCLDDHTDEMASCQRVGNKIQCTCYCPWGCEI